MTKIIEKNNRQPSKLVEKLLADVGNEKTPNFIKSHWGKSTNRTLSDGPTIFKATSENKITNQNENSQDVNQSLEQSSQTVLNQT